MIIRLAGQIDSTNAKETENRILKELDDFGDGELILDTADLTYISSAGLRVILRLKQTWEDMRIINASSEIYEILDMVGFTEMMSVDKAYRVVSIEGCEEIGRGANGTIYRIDQDNVVKVYNNADALDDIQHEREVARLALILGIPTAISYDVVKVGDSYGSVFELLNARSFSKILAEEPEKLDWCVKEYVKMLRKIHGTLVPAGKLPDMRETVLSWARFMKDYLPEKAGNKLLALVEAVPHDDHMLHGDYHTKNLQLQNDEVLIIDMDTLTVGHPIFELASMYNAYVGFYECDHEAIKSFQGYDWETGKTFWRQALATYLGTNDEEKLRQVEDKARIIGYARMIRRSIRRRGLESEQGKNEIAVWTEQLVKLLDETNSLLFLCDEMELEAKVKNLPQMKDFVEAHLEEAGCPMDIRTKLKVAVEEIFTNICHYAYGGKNGNAILRIEIKKDPVAVIFTFLDNGIPYDPLAKEDPDIHLPSRERLIGGLGIFMTKRIMDDIVYEYKDGKNILTLKKNL